MQQASTTWLTSPSVLQLLTLNGLILCFNAVTLLYADLRMAFPKKQHRFVIFLFWLLIYFAVFLPFYIVTDFGGFFGEGTPLQLFLNDLSVSPVGFNLAGVILSVISLIIFIRRQSYAAS
ncbi:MAG: hypothetical protein ACE5I1_18175 [bacterium]